MLSAENKPYRLQNIVDTYVDTYITQLSELLYSVKLQ